MVLIILALLAVMAMGLSRMAGVQIQQMLVKKQIFEGYLHVQDSTQVALFRLLTGEPGPRLFQSGSMITPTDGSPLHLAGLLCHIQDEAGLLSLGEYDEARFKRLLQRLTDKKTALKLAARLGDWLDEDSRPRYQGMESADYIAAGLPIQPRNGPLRSLDELLELPGMTSALFNGDRQHGRPGLRDLLIAGGMGWFNAAAAPQALLEPYLKVTAKQAKLIVRARESGDWSVFNEAVRSGGITYWELSPDMPGRAFRIRCDLGSGLLSRIQIQLKSRQKIPYIINLMQYPDYERF